MQCDASATMGANLALAQGKKKNLAAAVVLSVWGLEQWTELRVISGFGFTLHTSHSTI
jgi:hypothetical protein